MYLSPVRFKVFAKNKLTADLLPGLVQSEPVKISLAVRCT